MEKFKSVNKNKIITVEGDLLISSAAAFKKSLSKMGKDQSYVIDIRAVEDIDIAGMQLLCAAHLSSGGEKITLTQPLSDTLKKKIESAGFLNCIGCSNNIEKSCLWKGVSEK
ncbi:STAS domain-containing protein [bacterium]|nr:STAS domain-containing protein [bacterium]